MQTKAKCDDQNAKNSYHRAIANELGHRFETTNYTCCSTSCCYPDLTDLQSETKTTSGTINKKENTEVQMNAKKSDSTGIKISKNLNVIPLAHNGDEHWTWFSTVILLFVTRKYDKKSMGSW